MGSLLDGAISIGLSLALLAYLGEHDPSQRAVTIFLLCTVCLMLLLRLLRIGRTEKVKSHSSSEAQDLVNPLLMSYVPSNGIACGNQTHMQEMSTDLCDVRFLSFHKPTHQKDVNDTGEYAFSPFLHGKKRLWEMRFQLRFKTLPKTDLFFGLECGGYIHVAGMSYRIQKLLIQAIRSVVGNDFYHSLGDDPAKTSGEVEVPQFIMPLFAFDQFIVSEVGSEPDLAQDLSSLGSKRTEVGVRAYAAQVKDLVKNLSTDKVYTFCFWGISRFLDVINWEICGVPGLPGLRMNFNEFCGAPPTYVGIYTLNQKAGERRHLTSLKNYYMKMAVWSAFVPPKPDVLRKILGPYYKAAEADKQGKVHSQESSSWFACCVARPKNGVH